MKPQDQYSEYFCDIAIIGSGIAGASLGYFLATHKSPQKMIMLEQEPVAAYHTTGRSAAFLLPLYGGKKVAPLTQYTRDFLAKAPPIFGNDALVTHRGAVHIADHSQTQAFEKHINAEENKPLGLKRISVDEACGLVPILQKKMLSNALYDPGCYDLDVAAIHGGFMRGFLKSGASLLTNGEVVQIDKNGDGWVIQSKAGIVHSKTIINAAGAWGDVVAKMAGVAPLGLNPLRRTIVVCPFANVDKKWPLVVDVEEKFYFRPEGDGLLASPADETPSTPCDCQPEEEDVAQILYDLERLTGTHIEQIKNKWAGLRTFTPDRLPAIGFDKKNPDFFWCVGQGGFGIQTSAAIGHLAADLIIKGKPSSALKNYGIDAQTYSPTRFV